MKIGKAILDAIAPDDGEKKDEEAEPTKPQAFVPPPGTPALTAVFPAVPNNSKIYQGMCAKTSVSNCVNLQKYNMMKQTLSVIPDVQTRSKAALAASQVSVDSILTEIKSVRDVLNSEIVRANNAISEAERNTVTQTNDLAIQLEREIADKQNQLNGIKANVQAAIDKIKANREAVAAAGSQRSKDLDNIEIEFRSLGG